MSKNSVRNTVLFVVAMIAMLFAGFGLGVRASAVTARPAADRITVITEEKVVFVDRIVEKIVWFCGSDNAIADTGKVVAVAQTPAPVASSTPEPKSTDTVITDLNTPAATPSSTPEITKTVTPSVTPSATPEITKTPVVTETPSATPTADDCKANNGYGNGRDCTKDLNGNGSNHDNQVNGANANGHVPGGAKLLDEWKHYYKQVGPAHLTNDPNSPIINPDPKPVDNDITAVDIKVKNAAVNAAPVVTEAPAAVVTSAPAVIETAAPAPVVTEEAKDNNGKGKGKNK